MTESESAAGAAAVAAPAEEAGAADTSALDAPPNQTLYIRNLNEKVKIEQLKRGLYAMFSQFGSVVEIMAMKRYKTRGQAWVAFSTVEAATTAMHKMQGFAFYDKPMDIHFAKVKSDVIAKMDGTYRPREKRERAADKKAEPAAKKAAGPSAARAPSAPKPDLSAAPNKILFVQNVADEVTEEMLKTVFAQYTGLADVRTIAGKQGIAFVEYGDAGQAGLAMQGLQGFKMTPTHPLVISFAK